MLDRERVEDGVRFIRSRSHLEGPELARVVGNYVLTHFFGGDYEEFSRQSRSKPVSFRALAARLDLPFGAGKLRTLVRISRQLGQMPRDLGDSLSLAHHRALLPLSNNLLKVRLARAASAQAWTRSRLANEVRPHLKDSRVGRKPRLELDREVARVEKLAEAIATASSDAARREGLAANVTGSMALVLEESAAKLKSAAARLRRGSANT